MREFSNRKTPRRRGWDYLTPGYYFVTLNTKGRRPVFGKIAGGQMEINMAGRILRDVWESLPSHISNITLDTFIIMPDHFHGVVLLHQTRETEGQNQHVINSTVLDNSRRTIFPPNPKPQALPEIIRQLKTFSSRRINKENGKLGNVLWQRSFYDKYIRGSMELRNVRNYIADNPRKWTLKIQEIDS